MPNLLEATKEYWQELDRLEAAYNRGEISSEQVDAEVQQLMANLGEKRRQALNWAWQSIRIRLQEQAELIAGLALMAICFSGWMLTIAA